MIEVIALDDAVLDLGKVLLDHPVQLLDGTADTVDVLTDHYRMDS